MDNNNFYLNFPMLAAHRSAEPSGKPVSSSRCTSGSQTLWLPQTATQTEKSCGHNVWSATPNRHHSGYLDTHFSIESTFLASVGTDSTPTATATTTAISATASRKRSRFNSSTPEDGDDFDDDDDDRANNNNNNSSSTATAAPTTFTSNASTSASDCRNVSSEAASMLKPLPKNAVELIVAAISSCPSTTPTLTQIASHIQSTVPAYSDLEMSVLIKMVQHHLHENNPDYFLPVMSSVGQISSYPGTAKWAINRQVVTVGEDGSVSKRRQRSHSHKTASSFASPYGFPLRRSSPCTPSALAGDGDSGRCFGVDQPSFSHGYPSTVDTGATPYYYNNTTTSLTGFVHSADTDAASSPINRRPGTAVNCVFGTTGAPYNVSATATMHSQVPAAVPMGDAVANLYGVPLPFGKVPAGTTASQGTKFSFPYSFAL